jgi:hypothetical protein
MRKLTPKAYQMIVEGFFAQNSGTDFIKEAKHMGRLLPLMNLIH